MSASEYKYEGRHAPGPTMTAAQATAYDDDDDDDDDQVIRSRGQLEQTQQLVQKRIMNLVWGPKGK